MFGKYLDGTYDLAASWVIGDRETDRKLAENLGARALLVSEMSWAEVAETIRSSERSAVIARKTAETDIYVRVDLDGKGASAIDTGLKFLDHMLNQLVTHGGRSLSPSGRVGSPLASILMMATSVAASVPTTVASYCSLLLSVTVILVASCTTWLLVTI